MIYQLSIRQKPKPRPRVYRGRAIHDQEYRDWQDEVRAAICEGYGIPRPIEGYIAVKIRYKTSTKPRGDLDNLIGGILDALQPPGAKGRQGDLSDYPGVLWLDDSQIVSVSAEWIPSSEGITEIEVFEDDRKAVKKTSR